MRRRHQYGPGTSHADSRPTFFYVFGAGMNCVSRDVVVVVVVFSHLLLYKKVMLLFSHINSCQKSRVRGHRTNTRMGRVDRNWTKSGGRPSPTARGFVCG